MFYVGLKMNSFGIWGGFFTLDQNELIWIWGSLLRWIKNELIWNLGGVFYVGSKMNSFGIGGGGSLTLDEK